MGSYIGILQQKEKFEKSVDNMDVAFYSICG